MIRIYYWHPRYLKSWFGCIHIYRFGFVTGMKSTSEEEISYLKAHPDPNFMAGFKHGHQYHNQWKLKQLLKGK